MIKDLKQREYSNKIIAYVDNVFTKSLNNTSAKIENQNRLAQTISHKLINSYSFL